MKGDLSENNDSKDSGLSFRAWKCAVGSMGLTILYGVIIYTVCTGATSWVQLSIA
ncbi:hypothetical protein PSCICO_43240 [Pseudomonas cichorii]|nr:hypothetical protein PSCICO_43240 [Pseudomonas cichorii]